jgi:hypothetical protein
MSNSSPRDGKFNEFYDADFYERYLNSTDMVESLAFDPEFNTFIDNNWSVQEHTYKSRGFRISNKFLPEEVINIFSIPEEIYVTDISSIVSEYRNVEFSPEEIESYCALTFRIDDLTFSVDPTEDNVLNVYNSRYGESLDIVDEGNYVEKILIEFLKAQKNIDNLRLEDILYDIATSKYASAEVIKIVTRNLADYSGKSSKTQTTGIFSELANKNVVVQKRNTIQPRSENKSVNLHTGEEQDLYEYFLSTSMGEETEFITLAGQRELVTSADDLGIDILTNTSETQLIDIESGLDRYAKIINAIAKAAMDCSKS